MGDNPSNWIPDDWDWRTDPVPPAPRAPGASPPVAPPPVARSAPASAIPDDWDWRVEAPGAAAPAPRPDFGTFDLPAPPAGNRVIREIARGERVSDLQAELESRTRATGNEHGIFSMQDGSRILSEGSAHSIQVPPDARRIIAHTHPGGNPLASDGDRVGLQTQGQQHSYIVAVPADDRPAYVTRFDREQSEEEHRRASRAHQESTEAARERQRQGAQGQSGTAATTAGDAGGATAGGDCPNCIPGGGSRAGQAGTTGDAGVQAAPADPPPPPPGARSAPGAPPPPADGAEAFARAQRTGGSEHGGVVYAVGGTPGDHEVYRYTPDGQYLGPADRVPRGATEQGVASQIIDLQNPGVPRQRFFSGDNGERYAIGPEGMAEVRPDGSMRTLSPSERSSLPHHVQSQAMQRIAGPTLAMPDGVNGGMYRRLGQEVAGNYVDAAEIHRDIARAAARRAGSPPAGGPTPRR